MHSTARFVRPAVACLALDVKSATLRRWAKAGKIRHVRLPSGHYRYDITTLLARSEGTNTRGARPIVVDREVDRVQGEDRPSSPSPPESPKLAPAALAQRIETLAAASAV